MGVTKQDLLETAEQQLRDDQLRFVLFTWQTGGVHVSTWEHEFLSNIQNKASSALSLAQRAKVEELYERFHWDISAGHK